MLPEQENRSNLLTRKKSKLFTDEKGKVTISAGFFHHDDDGQLPVTK